MTQTEHQTMELTNTFKNISDDLNVSGSSCDLKPLLQTHVSVVDGLGAEADQQHQSRRTEEEDDGEVQVVDPTDQSRAAGRENTAARPEPELGQHPAQPHQQTPQQAPERPLDRDRMCF